MDAPSETERWKPIPEFEGFYEASTLGRIRSVERALRIRSRHGTYYTRRYPGCVIKPSTRGYRGQYLFVNLQRAGRQFSVSVHRAVLLAHVGPPPFPEAEVLHGPNHDPADNRLCNLRWGSHEENNDDRNRVNGYVTYAELLARARASGEVGGGFESDLCEAESVPF
jgi:hypothetical protein